MANCNLIKNIIRKVDLFGTFISFRVDHEIQYKSLIGGSCTIIYIIIAFSYIIYMIIPFLKRKEVTFTFSNKIIDTGPFVNLSSSNFIFSFGPLYLDDAASAIEDSLKYFNYSINITEWIGIDDLFSELITFRFCDLSDFPSSLKDQFEINELNELYCPIIEKSLNYSLDGLYTDDYYKFITINMYLSDYAKNHIPEVKDFMSENPLIMSFFFVDTAIDYENRYKPLPNYINYITKDIDVNYIKKSEIFLSSLEFANDEKFFFNSRSMIKEIMFDHSEDSFREIGERNFDDGDEGILFTIEMKVSPKVTNLKRKYQKIPEFVASLSGVLSFLLFAMVIIANLIERKAINQKLIHRMLKFNGNKYINIEYLINKFKYSSNPKKPNTPRLNEKKKKFSDFPVLINNSMSTSEHDNIVSGLHKVNMESIPYNENSSEGSEKNLRKEECSLKKEKYNFVNVKLIRKGKRRKSTQIINSEDLRIKTEQLILNANQIREKDLVNLSMPQIICNVFCFWCSPRLATKRNLLNQAENKINYYMDIITYIKTIQEFEVLKDMYLDKKSLRLFEFLSKSAMKIVNNNFVFCHRFGKENITFKTINESEIDQLYNSYQTMKNDKNNLSKKKQKLLNFVKNEINFFEG